MFRLSSMLYSIIGTTLSGSFIVGALVTGHDTLNPILLAAAVGAIIALPVSWLVARAILNNKI